MTDEEYKSFLLEVNHRLEGSAEDFNYNITGIKEVSEDWIEHLIDKGNYLFEEEYSDNEIGLFYCIYEDKYIAVDTTLGECYHDTFYTKECTATYLLDNFINIDALHAYDESIKGKEEK